MKINESCIKNIPFINESCEEIIWEKLKKTNQNMWKPKKKQFENKSHENKSKRRKVGEKSHMSKSHVKII